MGVEKSKLPHQRPSEHLSLCMAKGDPSALTSALKLYEGIEGIEEAIAEARAQLPAMQARLDQLVINTSSAFILMLT
jgi:hypothetical protein